MQTRGKASLTAERRYFIQRIVKSQSTMTASGETEMRQRQQSEAVKASREMLCCIPRRHGHREPLLSDGSFDRPAN